MNKRTRQSLLSQALVLATNVLGPWLQATDSSGVCTSLDFSLNAHSWWQSAIETQTLTGRLGEHCSHSSVSCIFTGLPHVRVAVRESDSEVYLLWHHTTWFLILALLWELQQILLSLLAFALNCKTGKML